MKKIMILLAVLITVLITVVVLTDSDDGDGGPPVVAKVLDQAHTVGFLGLGDPHDLVAAFDALVHKLPADIKNDPAAPIFSPEARQAALGFDAKTVEGWASVGIDVTAGVHVVFDGRLAKTEESGLKPVPIFLIKIVDRDKLVGAFTAKGKEIKTSAKEGASALASLGEESFLVGRAGDYTALCPSPPSPSAALRAAFDAFLAGSGARLADDPHYQSTFAGTRGGARVTGYLSSKSMATLFGKDAPASPADVTYYIDRFPALGFSGSAQQVVVQLLATAEGQATLAKIFLAKKNVSLARFLPPSGWSAQRLSLNLPELFTGLADLMPPSNAKARLGVLMAPALLGGQLGVGWDDISAALSGQFMVSGDMGSLTEVQQKGPAAMQWLAAVGLLDAEKGAAVLDTVVGKISQMGGMPSTPLDQDGLKGHILNAGPVTVVFARVEDAILVAGSVEGVKAAIAHAKGKNLASSPAGQVLDGPKNAYAATIDLRPIVEKLEGMENIPPEAKAILDEIRKDPRGRALLTEPMTSALAIENGIRLASEESAGMIALTGVLAAVAIPAFIKYTRRAKTSEATMNLRKLFDSTVTYYNEEQADRTGAMLPRHFPKSVALTPGNPTKLMCKNGESTKFVPTIDTWRHETWVALNFAVDDPFYYAYEFVSEGTGADAAFTVRAVGDLDCDGILSTFERIGTVDENNLISGGAGLFAKEELE